MEPLLVMRNLTIRYGRITAVRGVSLEVNAGEVVGLLGANGAGKSSLLGAIMGVIPAQGDLRFDGHSIVGLDPEAIVRLGISTVPEGRRLFSRLTVAENLKLGTTARTDGKSKIQEDIDQVLERFPILKAKLRETSGMLSGGQQQQLAIARALLARPRLMLLDEPSLGLDPQSVKRVFEIVREMRGTGIALLLAEQNARRAAEVVDRVYLLRTGRVARSGSPKALQSEIDYEAEYLGADT